MTLNITQLLGTARIDYTVFIKDWWIAFVHRTQLSDALSPTSAPKPWLFRGELAVQVEYLRLFRGSRPPSYVCQTLRKEARLKQGRAQGQAKSSDLALCCDGGLWHSGKEPACQCRRCQRCGFDPWVEKAPWRREWQLSSVSLPGEFHGQRSLTGSSPQGRKKLDIQILAVPW